MDEDTAARSAQHDSKSITAKEASLSVEATKRVDAQQRGYEIIQEVNGKFDQQEIRESHFNEVAQKLKVLYDVDKSTPDDEINKQKKRALREEIALYNARLQRHASPYTSKQGSPLDIGDQVLMYRDSGELRKNMSNFNRTELTNRDQAFYSGVRQAKREDKDYELMHSENLRLRQQVEVMQAARDADVKAVLATKNLEIKRMEDDMKGTMSEKVGRMADELLDIKRSRDRIRNQMREI